jgi:hypothetical protein
MFGMGLIRSHVKELDRKIKALSLLNPKSIEQIRQERILLGNELYSAARFSWWYRLWKKQPPVRQTITEKAVKMKGSMARILADVVEHDRMSWFNPLKWFRHRKIARYRKLCLYHYGAKYISAGRESRPVIENSGDRESFMSSMSKNRYGKSWVPRFLLGEMKRRYLKLSSACSYFKDQQKELEELRADRARLNEVAERIRLERKSLDSLKEKFKIHERRMLGEFSGLRQDMIGVLKQRSNVLDQEERQLQSRPKSGRITNTGRTESHIRQDRARIYTLASSMGVGHLFFRLPSATGSSNCSRSKNAPAA